MCYCCLFVRILIVVEALLILRVFFGYFIVVAILVFVLPLMCT